MFFGKIKMKGALSAPFILLIEHGVQIEICINRLGYGTPGMLNARLMNVAASARVTISSGQY